MIKGSEHMTPEDRELWESIWPLLSGTTWLGFKTFHYGGYALVDIKHMPLMLRINAKFRYLRLVWVAGTAREVLLEVPWGPGSEDPVSRLSKELEGIGHLLGDAWDHVPTGDELELPCIAAYQRVSPSPEVAINYWLYMTVLSIIARTILSGDTGAMEFWGAQDGGKEV